MATISSHTLNSVDGTHAGGIRVDLFRIGPAGERVALFSTATDAGGRLSQTVDLGSSSADAQYEMVLQTGNYFADRLPAPAKPHIIREIVVRFAMPDSNGRYHIPMMLAPNSYSVWWSS